MSALIKAHTEAPNKITINPFINNYVLTILITINLHQKREISETQSPSINCYWHIIFF